MKARFTQKEFIEAYSQVKLICENYPEITEGKAKMILSENISTETIKKQYDNTIKYINEYLE